MTKAGEKILAGADQALELARGHRRRSSWAELARYADACVDPDLTPHQQLQRLSMLLAILEEITAGIKEEAAV